MIRTMLGSLDRFVPVLVLSGLLLANPGRLPAQAADQDGEQAAKVMPLEIPDAVEKPVFDYAPEEEGATQTWPASPNPTMPMSFTAGDKELGERIFLLEDTGTTVTVNSDILGNAPPEGLGGGIYKDAAWAGNTAFMWTVNEVNTGKSMVADSLTQEFKTGFKNPGEYLLSCFADREFTWGEGKNGATALSSRGIGCFVADVTPPDFTLMITEYGTTKRTRFTLKEAPADLPPASKTYELSYDGVHFQLSDEERFSGAFTGSLPLQNVIDLQERKDQFKPLILKKGVTYLLNLEAKDNYQVKTRTWSFVDLAGRALLEDDIQRFTFPPEKNYVGTQRLIIKVSDPAGNLNEVTIPLRIVPK